MGKFLGKLLLFVAIILPIVICFFMLNDIWKDQDSEVAVKEKTSVDSNVSQETKENTENNINEIVNQNYKMGSDEFTSTIGAPTSKIVEGAKINVSVANIYLNPDEKSEIVDTIEKHTVVTTQAFPNGWSRIKSAKASGWVRTENISLPENNENVSVGSVVGRIGKVNVSSLNVRASASTTATIKNTLTENTEVKIFEISQDGKWYRIQWNSLDGWVSSQYITLQ